MVRKILVDATYPQETRVVLLNDKNQIEEFEYETSTKQQIKGNIYLAKIVRIEPSLQAAFIEYGSGKNGFLPFAEIHPIYYHIPLSDRDKIVTELQSIDRPNITQEDIASSKEEANIPDEGLLGLEADEIGDDIEESKADSESKNSDDAQSRTPYHLYNKYKIQDVIKKGQIILVQAEKESRGNKGASFTTYISLAGKYCVLMPNYGGKNGISRKIANAQERKRLRTIIDELISDQEKDKVSLIIRTAGIKKTAYDIKRDYDYLVRLWNKIREVTLQSTAPAFIHMEDDIIKKTIRDICDNNVQEILVQGSYAKAAASEIMHNMLPSDVYKVVEYKSNTPIFTKFGVEEQLSKLYQPISPLESGGYVVINPTEALISIDVNSGKATTERGIEETALRTNIEAAKEIARQLKLRDLSGLIVVDFIDMYENKNRKIVERVFREALSRDRARIQLGNISMFGLLEMSRQRLRSSFLEANTKICTYCSGKGIIRADESNSMLILRTIEQEVFNAEVSVVNVYANINSVIYLLNNKRYEIKMIEEKYKISLNFFHDHEANSDSFSIEKIKLSDTNNSTTKEDANKPALDLSKAQFDNEPAASSSADTVITGANNSSTANKQNRRQKKWNNNKNTISKEKAENTESNNAENIIASSEDVSKPVEGANHNKNNSNNKHKTRKPRKDFAQNSQNNSNAQIVEKEKLVDNKSSEESKPEEVIEKTNTKIRKRKQNKPNNK